MDELGVFQRTIHGPLRITVTALAEALARRETLLWLLQNNFDQVIVESDSLVMISKLNSTPSFLAGSLLSVVLGDCLALLCSFTEIKLNHVRRAANNAAHPLAKAVNPSSSLIRKEWLHPPFFSMYYLINNFE